MGSQALNIRRQSGVSPPSIIGRESDPVPHFYSCLATNLERKINNQYYRFEIQRVSRLVLIESNSQREKEKFHLKAFARQHSEGDQEPIPIGDGE